MTRIALIDGPLRPGASGCVALEDPWGGANAASPAGRHAAAVAAAITALAPDAEIISIPVFQGRLAARVQDLVLALETAARTGAAIVHCSLGLARNDAAVAAAIDALSGIIVVASAPARGAPVWPAALASVLSVQGDARCGARQWSHLGLPQADYGACPHSESDPAIAGASIAAAHLTGLLAGSGVAAPAAARDWLLRGAAHVGRERRTAAR